MTRIRFEDLPSTNTPRNAENLNKLNNVVISETEPTTGEEVWIQKGKNLWNEQWELGDISYSNGGKIDDTTRIRTKDYILVKPNTTYFIKTPNTFNVFQYDSNNSFIERVQVNNNVFTTNANTKYLLMEFTTAYGTTYKNDVAVFVGNTELPYEPYVDKKIYTKNDNGVYEKFYDENDNLEVYSTEEQVIGTWFGKPLYRKVIEFTMALEEGENNVPHGVTGLGKVIRKDIVNNSSSVFPYLDTNETASIFKVSSTDVTIKCIGGSWGSTTRQIILEYTKTTD